MIGMDDNSLNLHERSTAVIDLGAVRHNLSEFKKHQMRERNKPMLIFSSVKANAYGHGAVPVAKAIADLTDFFGVACVEEGTTLRESGISNSILVLGAALPDDFEAAVSHDITLTVFDTERAVLLDECAGRLGKKAKIHVAVDTGMSRIGLRPDESGIETVKKLCSLDNVIVEGAFTHFATADERDKTKAEEAHGRFLHFRELCHENGINIDIWHCANTAATIDKIGLEDEMDMVRCGIGIYGLYPSEEVDKSNVDLIPALKWFSCVSFVKDIKAGTSVSYGYNFTAEHDMRVATVSCGYADGYLRMLSRRGAEVIIRGHRCPVIGNICMDQIMVDAGNVPEVTVGDRAVLIGTAEDSYEGAENSCEYCAADGYCMPVTADELAERCDTISYEILCNISARTKRRYV